MANITSEFEEIKDANINMDYHLESKLSNIGYKFQLLEEELMSISYIWDFITTHYSGHPLQNIDEFSNDVTALQLKEDKECF